MPIVAFYAAAAGILFIILTVLVIRQRWKNKVTLGDGGYHSLTLAIRAHGNFAEVAPMVLVLLVVLAQLNAATWLLHTIGVCLVVGRSIHAYSLLTDTLIARPVGMVFGTFAPLLLAVGGCLYYGNA
jgi:uncharacterized protein